MLPQAVGPAAVLRVFSERSQALQQQAVACEESGQEQAQPVADLRSHRVHLLYVIDCMLSVGESEWCRCSCAACAACVCLHIHAQHSSKP